jgi:adenosylcobinamide kinase/adenosylcobinamide-phosphate guanylyltransferase
MQARIESHQARRPNTWHCLESPKELAAQTDSYQGYDVVLLDTVSAWISNRLVEVPEERCGDQDVTLQIKKEINEWMERLTGIPGTCIVVTDEVGLGGVAMTRLGRWFQDVIGDANQAIAKQAHEVYMVISGIPWRIKG